ncbi:hypothetical protein NP233_g10428 [Leucocoprinus birnbaumii]|uniref:HTH CENPB-type domain-containing protein n=1 Tax=Leucocoprinus birnbaumii TaxID=56174 RepID=A0AAD5VKT1_9AGAR|nr:hypothetical protein NP233_g10428 [Leucocoprinus birnbaumii]
MARRGCVASQKQKEEQEDTAKKLEKEKNLNDAVEAVRAGQLSVSAATKEFLAGVKRTTLRHRLKGTVAAKDAHDHEKLLPPEIERVLVDWIRFMAMVGRPVSRKSIRPKVAQLGGKLPSASWVSRFLKRHPELQVRKPSGLDPKRAQCFNPPDVNEYFQLLGKVLEEKNIPWENIYNMDEKGIQLGGGRKGSGMKYLFSRDERAKYVIRDGNLELVTIIESCCADGTAIKPGFVFSGKSIDVDIEDLDPDISIATSPNGWTSDFLCTEWFKKSFIPQAQARGNPEYPILLIFDGHGSHVTDEMVDLAATNHIELFCFPPHTTHKLQPLDVGVFGPLQRSWADTCDDYVARFGVGLRRRDVVSQYMSARNKAFKQETILKAWEKCGIRPLNPSIFKREDFAPSFNTSTILEKPESFPMELPSDFDIIDEVQESYNAAIDNHEEYSEGSDTEMEDEGEGQMEEEADDGNHDGAIRSTISFTSPTPDTPDTPHTSLSPVLTSNLCQLINDLKCSLLRPIRANASREQIMDENRELKAALVQLRMECNMAQAHAILIDAEYTLHRSQLREKSNQRKRPKLKIAHQWLTGHEALQERERLKQIAKEKAEKQAEREAVQQAAMQQHQERCAQVLSPDFIFTKSFSTMRRNELLEVIHALRLTPTDNKATIPMLRKQILDHFDSNPDLKTSTRYANLFRRTRGQALQPNPQPEAGPSTGILHPPILYPPTLPPVHGYATHPNLPPPPPWAFSGHPPT